MIIKYIIFLLLFISCASSKKSKDLEVVEIGFHQGRAVEITDINRQNEYGPAIPEGVLQDEEKKSNQKVIGLFLREGLYLTHGYLSLYRYLEKKKIKPAIQACLGYSCVITSLYAKYGNASQVEWKTFALWKKLKNQKIYSSSWKETLLDFLEQEFKGQRIEEMRGINVYYLWNNEKNKLFSLSQGDLLWALKHSVVVDANEEWESSVAGNYIASANDLKSFGADLVIDASITPSKQLFLNDSGYLIGLYGRLLTLQRRNISTVNFEFDLTLDENKNFSAIITHANRELKQNSQPLDDLMTQIFPLN